VCVEMLGCNTAVAHTTHLSAMPSQLDSCLFVLKYTGQILFKYWSNQYGGPSVADFPMSQQTLWAKAATIGAPVTSVVKNWSSDGQTRDNASGNQRCWAQARCVMEEGVCVSWCGGSTEKYPAEKSPIRSETPRPGSRPLESGID
jgi:hypothetical protein